MAASAPRDGLVFVPGTMDEVGVELLKHVDDPQDVIAYAGYGFWAPAAAVTKVKGASKQDLTNAPIAPKTAFYVEDGEYPTREVDEYGQPVKPDHDETDADPKANAPFPFPEEDGGKTADDARDEVQPADEKPAAKRAAAKKSDD